jgi:hypothetical protein
MGEADGEEGTPEQEPQSGEVEEGDQTGTPSA